MSEFYCTCGARLPDDARFCHKCGKPQFEAPAADPDEVPLQAVRADLAAAAAAPPDVGFGNPQAVRIGLFVALLSFFVVVLSAQFVGPGLPILPFVCLLGAGFISVYLYRRRTGLPVTLRSGARMGWMTGVFAFIILLVLLIFLVLAISDPSIASKLLADMKARGANVNAETMMEAFRNPAGIVQMILISFVTFTLFPALGGMLGAKLLNGRSR